VKDRLVSLQAKILDACPSDAVDVTVAFIRQGSHPPPR
jgi:hypothetical protein